jgi:hypothetical protein
VKDDDATVQLTADTFLNVLELPEIESRLNGAEQRDALFSLTRQYFEATSEVKEFPAAGTVSGELPLRIPGTALVVRLSAPAREEIKALLAVSFYAFGADRINVHSLTLVGAMALLARVQRLNADLGERAIVDALGEVSRKSAREVTLRLNGGTCRYPRSNCRYRAEDGKHCAISLEQVEGTLKDLVDRGLLRELTTVKPVEYTVVF